MVEHVKEHIKNCQKCQQRRKMFIKISPELHSIPILSEVTNQFGVDLCNLPEVNAFKHVIVCIDYFLKWSQAKVTKDKSAPAVASFLYEIICQDGCIKIQINDLGKKFVNQVAEILHTMTVKKQWISLA